MAEAKDRCLLCDTPVKYLSRSTITDRNKKASSSRSGSRSSPATPLISNQLQVIFLLRNVLEIPQEKLEVYLKKFGHPEEWIDLCTACEVTVGIGHRVYKEYLKVSKMLWDIKKDIIEVTQKSLELEGRVGRNRKIGGRKKVTSSRNTNVREECRNFVRNYNYSQDKPQSSTIFTVGHLESEAENDVREHETEVNVKVEAMDNPHIVENEDRGEGHNLDLDEVEAESNVSDRDGDYCPTPTRSGISESEDEVVQINEQTATNTSTPGSDDKRKSCAIKDKQCTICGMEFNTMGLLRRHGRVHATDRPHKCPHCGRGFKDKYNLKRHILLHEKKPNFKAMREYTLTDLEGRYKKSHKTPSECDICGRIVNNMVRHKTWYHGPNSNRKRSTKTTSKPPVCCSECGKMVTNLSRHKRLIHATRDPVACEVCGKMVKNLYYHNYKVHRSKPKPAFLMPGICDICGRNFASRRNLLKHVRIVHEKKLQFCAECGRGCESKFRLTEHMVNAHGLETNREFPCDWEGCDKVFKIKWRLYDHKKKHRESQSEVLETLKCNVCGKQLTTSSSFQRHVKLHLTQESKPFQCDFCNKAFASSSYLSQHQMHHCNK